MYAPIINTAVIVKLIMMLIGFIAVFAITFLISAKEYTLKYFINCTFVDSSDSTLNRYDMNTMPKLIPIIFFVLCMNVDMNKFIENSGNPTSIGVMLSKINCLCSKLPLSVRAI